ncbi:hypothetical protein [uncultured Campylobacter sp.]|uniref:hypothetical protein n=1 Tax=uncultured Campylobacter sp. TaxID=218934 RepID=UPI00261BDBAA|nr:hypothetical protein [uncultured Campylobacter sp.]
MLIIKTDGLNNSNPTNIVLTALIAEETPTSTAFDSRSVLRIARAKKYNPTARHIIDISPTPSNAPTLSIFLIYLPTAFNASSPNAM